MTGNPDDGEAPTPITVDVIVTIEDQILFNLAIAARPEARRRRLTWQLAVIFLAPLIGFAGGVVSTHLNSDGRESLLQVLGGMTAADWWRAMATIAAASGLVAAAALLMQIVRWPMLRWQLRRLLSERPGIPQDPKLREAIRATFDAEGYTATSAASAMAIRWPFVHGIENSGGLLIVQVGRKGGFILPKRDLSAEQLAVIPAFVASHVSRAIGSTPSARA